MRKFKIIFGSVLAALALAIFGYFLGFLSNLFKAVESDPFIVPSPDLHTAYSGLLDWEHLKFAFAVVGIILLIILFVVVKGRFDSRNHDDRNFSVSEKGTYGTAAWKDCRQYQRRDPSCMRQWKRALNYKTAGRRRKENERVRVSPRACIVAFRLFPGKTSLKKRGRKNENCPRSGFVNSFCL